MFEGQTRRWSNPAESDMSKSQAEIRDKTTAQALGLLCGYRPGSEQHMAHLPSSNLNRKHNKEFDARLKGEAECEGGAICEQKQSSLRSSIFDTLCFLKKTIFPQFHF